MLKFNYGEYVFQQIVTSEFVQHKLNRILIAIAVNLINMHIVSLLCLIISIHPYIDFFLHIGISVTCSLKVNFLYNTLERYNDEFYMLTQYLINNYSIDNYLYWKRIIVIGTCLYLCALLTTIQITNTLLYVYILQYTICFIIVEQFEQQRVQKWFRDYTTQPNARLLDRGEYLLINSYLSPRNNVLSSKQSQLFNADRSGSISKGPNTASYCQGLVTPNTIWSRSQSTPYNKPPN